MRIKPPKDREVIQFEPDFTCLHQGSSCRMAARVEDPLIYPGDDGERDAVDCQRLAASHSAS